MTSIRRDNGGRAAPWWIGTVAWLLAGCGGGAPEGGQGDAAGGPGGSGAEEGVIVLRADRVLDGRGGSMSGREVVVRDGRIEAVVEAGSTTGAAVYDLSGATLLPGLIDTHVHLGWHFDRETGRLHTAASADSPEDQALYAAENAWKMLHSGVTTVQSVGGAEDVPVRNAVAGGMLPGPRILTSIRPINAGTGGPAEMRAHVDEMAAAGADVIKIFASESIRVGGGPTLSQEQLDAACGRASEHGLRTVVHAHGPESASRAARADARRSNTERCWTGPPSSCSPSAGSITTRTSTSSSTTISPTRSDTWASATTRKMASSRCARPCRWRAPPSRRR